MNIILNTDKSYQLSELAKAVQLSDSDLIYVEQEIDGKKVSIAVERGTFLAGLIPSGKAIISGGATWSGTDLIFNVSQVVYRFDGDIDTTLPTQVTLANGGGQPRIDAIVVNAVDNSIEVVQGTEAANPPTPIIGEDQILIQYVLIGAGATEPNITEEVIYRENVEWTGSTVGTITGSVNFNSPNDPCYGSKTVEVSDCDRRARIRWTKISEVDLADYPLMTLTIQLPEPMPGNKKLIANFLRAGSNIGSTISLTNSGLNRNSLECQQLVINTAAFGSGMVDAFQLRMIGGAVNDGANWRVDDIVLFSGYAPPLNTPKINVEDDGTLIGETSDLNFIGGTNVTLNVTQGLDGKINVEINSVGGGGGGISSVVGTDEEIDVDNTDPDNPVLSLPSEVTDVLGQVGQNATQIGNNTNDIDDLEADVAQLEADLENYIPLSGTTNGNPVTGTIEFEDNSDESEVLKKNNSSDDTTIGIYFADLFANYYIRTDTRATSFQLDVVSIQIYGDHPDFLGIVGNTYYGANYTDLTYVQKKYVDDEIAAIATPPEEDIVGTAIYNGTMTGTEDLDLSTFTSFYGILTGNTTITVSNPPSSGKSFARSLKIKSDTTETLTMPTTNWNYVGEFVNDGSLYDFQIEADVFPTVGIFYTCYINKLT